MFKKQDTMDCTKLRQSQTEVMASRGKALGTAQSLPCTGRVGLGHSQAHILRSSIIPQSSKHVLASGEPRPEGWHSRGVSQLLLKRLGKNIKESKLAT